MFQSPISATKSLMILRSYFGLYIKARDYVKRISLIRLVLTVH